MLKGASTPSVMKNRSPVKRSDYKIRTHRQAVLAEKMTHAVIASDPTVIVLARSVLSATWQSSLKSAPPIMFLGGWCSPRYHTRTWVRGNLLNVYRE